MRKRGFYDFVECTDSNTKGASMLSAHEDVKYAVETDMYIAATVQIRICDTGKKQLEVSDPEIGKEAQYHLRQFIKCMKKLGRYC